MPKKYRLQSLVDQIEDGDDDALEYACDNPDAVYEMARTLCIQRTKLGHRDKAIKEALAWFDSDYKGDGATAEDVIDEVRRELRKVSKD